MDVLNLLEHIKGNEFLEELKNPRKSIITIEDVEDFQDLLNLNETYIKVLFQTEDSKEFYEAIPTLDTILSVDKKEDLFYAVRAGFFYQGIPAKLSYILDKALKAYEAPNAALSAIDFRSISKYLKKGALPEGITIKTILENIVGYEVELLSRYKKKVVNAGVAEIYVGNTDRVCILPTELADMITSREDLDNIQYIKEIGVCLYDKPLRSFADKFGVVYNDYDMRVIR